MTATQLVNADIDRVDAVNGPATGLPFLMFKSLNPAAEEAPAEVAKSGEEPAAEAPAEVAKSEDEAPAEPVEVAKSEAEDADKASKAAKTLAALRQVVVELAASEGAEDSYSSDTWDLMDAGSAIDYALAILAKFALTEAVDATVEKSQTDALRKALHLEVHEKPAEGEAAAEEPAAAPAQEAPVQHEAPVHGEPAPAVKAEEPLPTGLQEILDTFVESYAKFKEAKDSGAEQAVAEDSATEDALAEAPAAEHEEHAAPAPVAAPEHAEAPATHPAPAEAAHEAPAPAVQDPKKIAKSMDELIAEAVAKAVEEVKEPLLKRIDVLERTPVDSGPLLAGQVPGSAGTPLVRGQEEGAVTKGLAPQSVAAQTAPGAYALVDALKGIHTGR